MITNNRQAGTTAITEKEKVGVIILSLVTNTNAGGGTKNTGDINLDDIIDDNMRIEPPREGDDKGKGAGDNPPPPTKDAATLEAERIATEKVKSDGETAKKYGGTKLDDKGNVLDDAGKIVKTVEEITAETTPQAVTIDDKTYKLDAKGNALNDDGTVHKTKVELDALTAEEDQLPVVEEYFQKVGMTPVDDKGKPKVYEDSVDGLIAAARDVAEIKANKEFEKKWTANPKAKAYYDHIAAGGSDEEFFTVVKDDFVSITLDDKNIDQQKTILSKYLAKKGFTPEKSAKYIQRVIDSNELLVESKDALTELQATQVKDEKAFMAQTEQRENNARIEIETHWNKVNDIVSKGTVKGFVIPDADRKDFYEFMALAADENGYSKLDQQIAKEDLETKILLNYYRFKGYDVKALIRDAMNNQTASNLRTRTLRSRTATPAGTRSNNTPGGGTGVVGTGKDVSLDNLIN